MLVNGRNKQDKYLWQCLAICFVAALLSLGWCMLQDGGWFTVRDDFNYQQIPFTYAMQDAVRDGIGGWSWNLDLGTSSLQGFSFSELESPFFWLTLLFPASFFPYLVGWIYILKYVTAGLTAYLYIKRFCREPRFAVIGALLYSFSGFQTTNLMFYTFHDVTAFFPLLLLGIERLMEDKRDRPLFIFAVFINSFVNYFFFVQEAVFLIIYFLLRFWSSKPLVLLGRMLSCLFCAALGVGMAAVSLLPCALYMMGGARGSQGSLLSIDGLVWESRQFLYILKGFLLPGESMQDGSSVYALNYCSTSCYLPMAGVALALAYVEKERDWLSRLLLVLLVISLSPDLTAGFLLFKGTYQRWWYMLTLIMALASSIVIERSREYPIVKNAVINGLLVLLFLLVVKFLTDGAEGSLVYHGLRLYGYTAIALAGAALVMILAIKDRLSYRNTVAAVSVFAVVTTVVTLYYYRPDKSSRQDFMQKVELSAQLEEIDPQYRYDTGSNIYTMCGDCAGISSFSSTVSNSIFEFQMLFDYRANAFQMEKDSVPGLTELLGGRFGVTKAPEGAKVLRQLQVGGVQYYVTEKEACPIGYAVDDYILAEQLPEIGVEQRGIALLSAALVDESDEAAVAPYAEKQAVTQLDLDRPIHELVAENQAQAVGDFQRDNGGFSCVTGYGQPRLLYFSVPWDEGWTAYIDGQEQSIIKSGGMMLLPVPQGEHSIEFRYQTPGFALGGAVSILCFCAFGVITFLYYKPKGKSR